MFLIIRNNMLCNPAPRDVVRGTILPGNTSYQTCLILILSIYRKLIKNNNFTFFYLLKTF